MLRGWLRKLMVSLALVLALTGVAAASADAAPARFFGVHAAGPTASDFQRMAQGGVRICRVQVDWAAIEPAPGTFDWKAMDELVTEAARHGVELMPLLIGTPSWLSQDTARPPIYTEQQRQAWTEFLTLLVGRYGSGGSFWAEHPEVPRKPVVIWQIWNEVNTRTFWGGRPNPAEYAQLVGITASTIHASDPLAKVILAGLIPFRSVASSSVSGMKYLERLLKFSRVRRVADGVAIHPYGKRPDVVLKWLRDSRMLLNRLKAKSLPLWATEFGWSTGGTGGSPVGASRAAQARRVGRIYQMLARNAKRLRLQAAFYFSYRDIPVPGDVWIGHMGLLDSEGQPKPAWYTYTRKAGGTP